MQTLPHWKRAQREKTLNKKNKAKSKILENLKVQWKQTSRKNSTDTHKQKQQNCRRKTLRDQKRDYPTKNIQLIEKEVS